MLMALQAGASGIGWTPVPGLLGTDVLARRPDYRVVDDPYAPGRQVVLVPALRPQFALVHARRADERGNAVISTAHDDRLLIQAAHTVLMTVESVEPGATERLHAGEQVVPAAYIDVQAVAPREPTGRATREYLDAVRA